MIIISERSVNLTNYDRLKIEVDKQSTQPAGQDARIALFSQVFARKLIEHDMRVPIEQAINSRKEMSGSYAANLLLRCFQKQFIRTDSSYPLDYTSEDMWDSSIDHTYNSSAFDELINDLKYKSVQSNISERYKSIKLLINMYPERFSKRPSILDIGCSRNHGLKRLALNYPFAVPQTSKTNLPLALLLSKPLNLGECIGTDLSPITAEGAEWIRACSFYPSELLINQNLTDYDLIDKSKPSNVDFRQSDFIVDRGSLPDIKFDIVFASTFLYQLSSSSRAIVRKAMEDYAKPDGLIIYQDFVEIDALQDELIFIDNWFEKPYSYRTIVQDSNSNLLEYFNWQNGRCQSLKLGEGLPKVTSL